MLSKTTHTKMHRIISLAMVFVMTFALLFSVATTVSAEVAVNQEVNSTKDGILQIRLVYNDGNDKYICGTGTCFLINENTVLTAAHVVEVDDVLENDVKSVIKKTYNENNYALEIVISRQVVVPAKLKNKDIECDFAIVTINEAISGYQTIALGDSDTVESTQECYALGFPALVSKFQDTNTYTSDDVTITNSKVSKVSNINGVDYIQHTAQLTGGFSGGPLVDDNGVVIGINRGYIQNKEDTAFGVVLVEEGEYYYSSSINQVKDVLDKLDVDYTDAAGAVETVTEAEVATEAEAPVETLAPATEPIAEPDESDNDITKVIIIVAIAILVIVLAVVVVVVLAGNKKKSEQMMQAQNRNMPPMQGRVPQAPVNRQAPPQPPVAPQPYGRPMPPTQGGMPTVPSNEGAGETSVLNDGAGETTVLGNQAAAIALIRKSNNEKISVNKADFIIGKERRRVDYCISDNNSVSRAHAKLSVRAGRCYISDLGSTNCTYVNGTKLSPNKETILSKGDKIKISDEEFEFLG